MKDMTSQQNIEIGFWRDLLRQKGSIENFMDQRKEDWNEIKENLPELSEFLGNGDESTKVLEIGSGLVSPLQFADSKCDITSIDPLMSEYQDTIDLMGGRIHYLQGDGEKIAFPDGEFNAVVCINVIDHTPTPANMIAEIKRVLKPGGKLFFEVNFDESLSPAHYALWDQENVDAITEGLKLISAKDSRRDEYNQTCHWAVYERV